MQRWNKVRLVTKLWVAMGLMVAMMVLIILATAWQSRQSRAEYGAANEALMVQVKRAHQWANLVDVNATRAHAVVVAVDPGVAKAFKDDIADTNARIDVLQQAAQAAATQADDQAWVERLAALRSAVQDLSSQVALIKVTRPGDMPAFLDTQYRPAVKALQAAHHAYVDHQDGAVAALAERFEAQGRRLMLLSAGSLAALVAGILIGAAWLIGSIQRPLLHANQLAARIAGGDLSGQVDETRGDEFGELMRSLAGMNRSLADMVAQVRRSTDSIETASAEIASGNNDLAQRTEQASGNLAASASSMHALSDAVRVSADRSLQAQALSTEACAAAQRGGEVVGRVVRTMGDIDVSSQKIAAITAVIDGIAFQTNILALNAAVEAARAGEQGRGFAVVAAEVRQLAGRSAAAAKEIKALIGTSVANVATGTGFVAEAGDAMQEIVQAVQRLANVMADIGAATVEQRDGIADVSAAVTQLDQMTQQNAALVEESAAAAEQLRDQAAHLAQTVALFKLNET